jgi:AraC-like DNA-binding protein
MWERHRSVLKRGRKYGLRWHQADLTNISLTYIFSPSSIRVDCAPMSDTYRITMHETGRLDHRINGLAAVSTPRRAVLHAPGQELHLETEPFSTLLLTINGDFVRRGLAQRLGRKPTVDEWLRERSLTTPSGAALRALCRWTARELDRPEAEILNSDRAAASLERTLLMLFLDCVADHYPIDERRIEDLNEVRVRHIEEWVDANFAEPIGIEDLAHVAGMSVRSIQTSFRRSRGCTPMQMVVRRRLEAAHKTLTHAVPGTRITQVAVDCGFFNFGRFSRQYRELFGETPSQTLKRGAN